jgi:hypothetical protein
VDDHIEDAEMGYEIALSTVSNAEPLSYAEALQRPDAEQWKHAALEELNAHSTNGTWKLIPRRVGKKVIGSKWVFKVKCNADGSIEYYKGRVVAKGYNQRPGFDYIEIFAPTVRMPTIRVVLAISALHDYHLHSIDISHAYLNGEMDCDIYMEQPEGFAQGNPRQTVCLLQESIYGTKQGGNCWNKKMRAVLESMGFTQSYSDTSIYVYVKGDT